MMEVKSNAKEQYCMGTWNVRSMNQGKLEVVKQEMARVNIDILGISELKWTGMGDLTQKTISNGTPLQCSCLENPMEGGAWWAPVRGAAKSQPQLSDFTFTFHFHAWEKEMATHSSVLAWRIPGMVEPGGLPSMGSHRLRHD